MPSSSNLAHLLRTRRFVPLFLVQFLGAFNDNVFKSAFSILATYHFTTRYAWWNSDVATQVIAGAFIAPFMLFSAWGGQIADKFEKARIVRFTKVWEMGAMLLAAAAFVLDDPWLMFATLVLTGSQAAFFGPLKYSLLPCHLREEELVGGNALFEAATYVAILGGSILGTICIRHEVGREIVMGTLLAVAAAGWLASLWVPRAEAAAPSLRINANLFTATRDLLGCARRQPNVFRVILGLSWFWLIGAFWLTHVPAYVEKRLHADEWTVMRFFVLFSVGVGAGALLCNRLLRGRISAKFVPLAGLGVSLFMADVAWLTAGMGGRFATETFSILSPAGLRLSIDLFGIAACGGIFSVPLYAMMQAWAEPGHRSRVVAANNVMNSVFMVAIAAIAGGLFARGAGSAAIVAALAAANAAVSIAAIVFVPEAVVHTLVRGLLRLLFRVDVRGLENYPPAGRNRVIIANHTSFLDAVLLSVFLPERPAFAINTEVAKSWWVRPFLWAARVHPLDPTKPMAVKILADLARKGEPIVVFPEGRLTVTGTLMKIYEGPGLIADKADADLVPVQIDGAQFSRFSRLRGKVRQRWFPKVALAILPPRKLHPPPGVHGRAARQYLARELYELLAGIGVATAETNRTLFASLLEAAAVHGAGFEIVDDLRYRPISYRKLIAASLLLSRKLCAGTEPGQPVGLLLPNSTAAVAAFFAVQSSARVCAMLNYSAGPASLVSACRTACIATAWTSRRFVEAARLEGAVEALPAAGVRIGFMEDAAARGLGGRLRLPAYLCAPAAVYRRRLRRAARQRAGKPGEAQADTPAVVLFTSGSSGTPKAVVLSHRNLHANRHQLGVRIDFTRRDRFFNCLPVFHAFGLTGGTLVPILAGVPVFMYPTPLHYGIVPELVYQTSATILFGTNTFLAGYARRAHPYDFFSVRYVFAGAEKLKESVRATWASKFGVRVFEGYGATETAPALTMNTPMFAKPGTAGRFLPGIQWRIEPVPGIERGGRLHVRGANVMLGYFLAGQPGQLQPPPDGWYDTGDIVEVDDEGFVTILGRARRFAKVAGEMVSLAAVEDLASAVWPAALHAAVARPHPLKGEEIVLVTEQADAARGALLAAARQRGASELTVPRTIVVRKRLPVLGSGKPDYVALEEELRQDAPAE
jgi:acyl-[acyl-carrier-protein]-phospholipid O-acyltransferase/long-chain-fatty-acid--[acyl-carrier-protein] ligase